MGPPALIGTSAHAAAEANYQQKIESRQDLPIADFRDLAAGAFERAQAEGFVLTAAQSSRGAVTVLGEAKDKAVSLAEYHAKKIAPQYQPVMVEQAVRIELPGSTHDLLAVIDLADEEWRVIDFKHSAKRWKAEDAHHSVQLTIYAAGYQVLTGHEPAELRIEVLHTWDKPSRSTLKTTRGVDDYAAVANRINAMLRAIDAGIFPPANPGAWWCSPSYCGYWRTCPYVNGLRRKD